MRGLVQQSHQPCYGIMGGSKAGHLAAFVWRRSPTARPKALHAFIRTDIAKGATVKTAGWKGYARAPDVSHTPHVIGPMGEALKTLKMSAS